MEAQQQQQQQQQQAQLTQCTLLEAAATPQDQGGYEWRAAGLLLLSSFARLLLPGDLLLHLPRQSSRQQNSADKKEDKNNMQWKEEGERDRLIAGQRRQAHDSRYSDGSRARAKTAAAEAAATAAAAAPTAAEAAEAAATAAKAAAAAYCSRLNHSLKRRPLKQLPRHRQQAGANNADRSKQQQQQQAAAAAASSSNSSKQQQDGRAWEELHAPRCAASLLPRIRANLDEGPPPPPSAAPAAAATQRLSSNSSSSRSRCKCNSELLQQQQVQQESQEVHKQIYH
ncbi:hypothetical protein Emed_000279 [Eimeria media]